MNPTQYQDLRRAHDYTTERAVVVPCDLEAITFNSRYARELLATLASKGLGIWDGVEYRSETYHLHVNLATAKAEYEAALTGLDELPDDVDPADRADIVAEVEALAHAATELEAQVTLKGNVFDQAFGWSDTPKVLDVEATDSVKFTPSGQRGPNTRQEDKMTRTETGTERTYDNPCGCGCGQMISKRSTFAQGHDAKMVSKAAQNLVHGYNEVGHSADYLGFLAEVGVEINEDIQVRMDVVAAGIARRFGDPLATKYVNAAYSAWDKWTAKSERTGSKKGNTASDFRYDGMIKVGRWEYPTQTDGSTRQRNTKRDGSGEWVEVG